MYVELDERVTQRKASVRERDPLCRTRTQCCCGLKRDTVHPVCVGDLLLLKLCYLMLLSSSTVLLLLLLLLLLLCSYLQILAKINLVNHLASGFL